MPKKTPKKAPSKSPEPNSQEETGQTAKETTAAVYRVGVSLSGYGRLVAGDNVTKADRIAFASQELDIENFIK